MPVIHQPGKDKPPLQAALAAMRGRVGRVGWFSSSKYPDGLPAAYVAAIHEFGVPSKNIPPRMGLRQLVVEKQGEWTGKIEIGARQVLKGAMTGEDLLHLIGAVAEADIRQRISKVQSPALAPRTLQERARRLGIKVTALTATGAKPLVEPVMSKRQGGGSGGYLLATVTHDVTDKGSAK